MSHITNASITVHWTVTDLLPYCFHDWFVCQIYVVGYTCQMFAWSLWARSSDTCGWPLDARLIFTDCTHKLLLYLSSINEWWENKKYHNKHFRFIARLCIGSSVLDSNQSLSVCKSSIMWSQLPCLLKLNNACGAAPTLPCYLFRARCLN